MNPERWQQVKGMLDQALELTPEERSSFLDRACSTDHSLRHEVESLLSSDGEARSSFLASEMTRVTLSAGTKLGDYEVQSLLGSGGMGVVYCARDQRLGREVAIKVLPPFFTSDRVRMRRFEQEARAAAALNHPNILAVYQLGAYEGSPYLVSELLEGETLRARLKRGPIPLEQAMEYAWQIARGLAAAHAKGIVHRDLKPENLFVTRDGQVKILDFGLAKQTHREPTSETKPDSLATEAGVVMGTVGYMSPEQVRGQAADFRSDIFSFGAILYEMLSGRRAFTGESSADVAGAILKDDPPRLAQSIAGVPKALESVVQRCLEKAPEQRFQCAEELSAALGGIELQPVVATLAWPFLRRHWQLITRAIILVAITVAVVASVSYFRRHQPSIDSIAVMPFVTNSADTGTDLGDGLTSGLIESLSQIPNLRVMSRSSVSHYKGQEIDPRKVGRELNVRAVLTGILTPRGDSLLLDAELINTDDNSHLWGQQYTTKPADVLTLQANLAQAVSTKLHPGLAMEAKARLASPGTSNPEAYALYVKGRYAWDRFEPKQTNEALAYFQQAVEKDSAYAQAYAGMADAYAFLAFFRSIPFEEGIQQAKAAAQRALALDPNLAEVHCSLANTAFAHREWEEASKEARRSVELNPNLPAAHQIYAWTLQQQTKLEEGLAEQKRVLELDPVSFMGNSFLVRSYEWVRDYDRAIELQKKLIDQNPPNPDLHDLLATIYEEKGDYEQAAVEEEKSLVMSGKANQAEMLRRAYAKDGFRGFLKVQIELWSDPQKTDDYSPRGVAENYSLLGDTENAFRWLDKAYDYRDTGDAMQDICCDILLDHIRSDPRFHAFLVRMGYPP
jgi:serine/threonine protein kinase/tetratricopeptide (TPR) repeat protein